MHYPTVKMSLDFPFITQKRMGRRTAWQTQPEIPSQKNLQQP